MEFLDRVVIITGGSMGIGRESAAQFLAAGAKVVLNGRRADLLAETAKSLDPSGERIAIESGDIGTLDTAKRLVAKAIVDTQTGRILGCTLFCHAAGELISTVQMVMFAGIPYTALRDGVLTHPTMTEGLNMLFAKIY